MKKIGAAFVALSALFATPILAADLPTKMASPVAPVPAPIPSWTGCYIGGNVGAAWTNDNMSPVNASFAGVAIPQGTGAGSAVAGGGQFGCDYQVNSNWVVGMRGMWDATKAQGTAVGSLSGAGTTIILSTNAQITSFATAVARVGYSLGPALLVYGVGGVAFAQNQYSQNLQVGSVLVTFPGSDAPTGWAAGAGVSWMLARNWDVWLEYNYLGFGERTVTTENAATAISLTNSNSQRVQTILVGVDFRFTNWAAGQFGL
jgi:outer membrane immunogenic protein